MTAKQIAYDVDARERMLRGIQKLAKAVKITLGPSGRVAVLDWSRNWPLRGSIISTQGCEN